MKINDQKQLESLYEDIYEEGIRSALAQAGSNIGKMFAGDQQAAFDKTYKIFANSVLKSVQKMEQTIANAQGELPSEETSPAYLDVQKVTKWLKPFLENKPTGEWTYNKALNPSSSSASAATTGTQEVATKEPTVSSSATSASAASNPSAASVTSTAPNIPAELLPHKKAALVRDEINKYLEIAGIKNSDPSIRQLLNLIQTDIKKTRPRAPRSKKTNKSSAGSTVTPTSSAESSPTAGTVVAGGKK